LKYLIEKMGADRCGNDLAIPQPGMRMMRRDHGASWQNHQLHRIDIERLMQVCLLPWQIHANAVALQLAFARRGWLADWTMTAMVMTTS